MLMGDLRFAAHGLRWKGLFQFGERRDDGVRLFGKRCASTGEDRRDFGHDETVALCPNAVGRFGAECCYHSLIDKPSSNWPVVLSRCRDRARSFEEAARGVGRPVRIGEHWRILSSGPSWSVPLSPPPLSISRTAVFYRYRSEEHTS